MLPTACLGSCHPRACLLHPGQPGLHLALYTWVVLGTSTMWSAAALFQAVVRSPMHESGWCSGPTIPPIWRSGPTIPPTWRFARAYGPSSLPTPLLPQGRTWCPALLPNARYILSPQNPPRPFLLKCSYMAVCDCMTPVPPQQPEESCCMNVDSGALCGGSMKISCRPIVRSTGAVLGSQATAKSTASSSLNRACSC